MPGYVQAANPTVVMPYALAIAFQSSRSWAISSNGYANGEYQSAVPIITDPVTAQPSNVASSRRTWQQTKKLTAPQWQALLNFWNSQRGCTKEFWFYDWFETSPLLSYDQTGQATQGRYTVRFNGDLTMAIISGPGDNFNGIWGRAVQTPFSLIEVA